MTSWQRQQLNPPGTTWEATLEAAKFDKNNVLTTFWNIRGKEIHSDFIASKVSFFPNYIDSKPNFTKEDFSAIAFEVLFSHCCAHIPTAPFHIHITENSGLIHQ